MLFKCAIKINSEKTTLHCNLIVGSLRSVAEDHYNGYSFVFYSAFIVMMNGTQKTQSVGQSSSSTSLSSQQDQEDDRMIALVLSEDYAKLDGAVARRLSNLAPIPVRRILPPFFPFLSFI